VITRKISLNHLLSFSRKNKNLILHFKNRNPFIGFLAFLTILILYPFTWLAKIILNLCVSYKAKKRDIISWSFSINQKKILTLLPYKNFHISADSRFRHKSFLYNILKFNFNYYLLIDLIKSYHKAEVQNNWYRFLKFLIIEPTIFSLTKNSKKCIIANDHSIQNLYLIEFCVVNGIKLIYIQHAPVNNKFLPLKVDLAILYSEWAKNLYQKLGTSSKTKIILIGDIPISMLMEKYENQHFTESVLVCTNLLDDLSKVVEFCNYLEKKSFKVVIRKHPADIRNWKNYGFEISLNSLIEDLNNSKFILVNESAVLLEAMALNKFVYKCNFSESIDNYGFKKNGIILEEYDTPEDLCYALSTSRISYISSNLKYYTGDIKPVDELTKYITQEIKLL